MDDRASDRRFPWLPCLAVFALALAVRVFFFLKIPRDYLLPNTDWELDSIAMSIVETGRFADAYVIPTGPTAHLPPVAPYLLAGIYRVFGVTMLGGVISWTVQIVLQSAVWGLLPWAGRRIGVGWKAGFIGGLAGACIPIWLGHGETPAALLLVLLSLALVSRWDGLWPVAARGERFPGTVSSLLLGAVFGFAFHAQPVFLLVFLGYLAFELWRRTDRLRWTSSGFVLAGAVLISIPWGVRNARAFDGFFFVRSNFGLELQIGNHDGARANIDHPHYENYGAARDWSHPRIDVDDAIEVRDSGEVAYMRRKGRQAAGWIAANPGEFARLTAERIGHFWFGPLGQPGQVMLFGLLTGLAIAGGLVVARTLPAHRTAILLIPLLTYPLVYYLVPWQHRYRFPIEWILYLLAGTAVWAVVSLSSGTPGWLRTR